ncbi:MAG: glycosyltransferase family 4 protein [Verrucomicrobia bacterium]|nr:glycosyltransferase family 4 protein [Verrucomicrobiota bacterium]
MLAVIPEQTRLVNIAAMGFYIDGKDVPKIRFDQFFKHCRNDRRRIWHARRNIDMLAGLILKFVFRFKLILIFTSAAQRHHTGITRFYCRHMEEIISPTSAAAAYLTRQACVVPHGVDPARFFPPENRALEWAERTLSGKHGIGIFGRIRPNKGTREFVEAAIQTLKSRPEWTAVIIGETTPEHIPFERELRSLIKKAHLEDRILFMGFQKNPDAIPHWLRALSIVACASHKEGFGLPCLEAMASGCAVIATHTGAWPEIIQDDKNGLLIPIKNSGALAEAFAMLMDNPEQRESMGLEARRAILNNYRIKNEAEGIQAVYEKIFNRYRVI